MNGLLGPCVAEMVGTFYLCFIGAGAICTNAQSNIGLVGIALAHGLALAIGVSATMGSSGGHLNPAVSIALFVTKKIDATKMVAYIAAQMAGAILAGVLLRTILPDALTGPAHLGTPGLGEGITAMTGVMTEIFLTFLLLFSVFGTAVDPRAPKIGGFGIGLTVAMDILMGGPISGAAMNPARHTGIALVAGHLENTWVYWVGPILGGLLGALVYDRLILNDKK